MSDEADRYAPVIRQIEAAFVDVTYPGDEQMLHPDCFDDMDIAAFYGSTSWPDIPAKTIALEYAALSFVSAAGFQFLIPAYMIWTLRNINADRMTVESTLWSLDIEMSNGRFRDFRLSKCALLTAEQRAAIKAFLTVLLDHRYLAGDAKTALDGYWDSVS